VRETGEPNTTLTAVLGVVFALALFALVVFLQAFFYRQEAEENVRKVVAVAPEDLARLKAQQLETLHGYRYVDARAGVVAIPIDRAMELVVRDGGKSPWPDVQPPSAAAKAAPPAPGLRAKE
jgi:hypothetical protein